MKRSEESRQKIMINKTKKRTKRWRTNERQVEKREGGRETDTRTDLSNTSVGRKEPDKRNTVLYYFPLAFVVDADVVYKS